MSFYNNEITNLLNKCDSSNKKIILDIIEKINVESDNFNIELLNIEKINNIFFKKSLIENEKYSICTLCDNTIISKEHKIKLNLCSHIFHKKCLNKILKKCLTNFTCPICHTNYKSQLESIAFNIINLN